jgi:hypothetical protein
VEEIRTLVQQSVGELREWANVRVNLHRDFCNGVRGKPKVLEIPGAKTEILGANNGCGCKDTGCKACVDDYKRRGDVI